MPDNPAFEPPNRGFLDEFYSDPNLNPPIDAAEPDVPAAQGANGGDGGAPNLAGILDHVLPFDLNEIKRLDQKAGRGLNLGLHFYKRGAFAPEALKFRGITVFSARTGGGKTLFATSLCAHALATKPDYHAVFLSLEESKAAISKRLLAAYLYYTEGAKRENGTPLDAISLDEVDRFIHGERLQMQEEIDDALLRGLQPHDGRINDAAIALSNRLTVLDIESFDEARSAYAQSCADAARAEEFLKAWRADQSPTVKGMIAYFRKKYDDKVLFFVDYAQRLHNDNVPIRSGAAYKEIQAVMADLISEARQGAIVFLAAQMNREGAKASGNKYAAEFYGAYSELLREAADIEQAAEMILYLTIDRDTNRLNMRLLKYRNGDADQAASVPIKWSVRAALLSQIDRPSLIDPENKDQPRKDETKAAYAADEQRTQSSQGTLPRLSTEKKTRRKANQA